MSKFPFLRAAILAHPWAIMPDRLEAMVEVVSRRFDGIRLDRAEIDSIKGERVYNGTLNYFSSDGSPSAYDATAQNSNSGGPGLIAVINVMGVIAQHASQVDDVSGAGGTSTERVANSFRAAISDPSVKAIILNVDSPGGNVNGVQALADEIFKARGTKPVIAQANSLIASAAYWIASQADEIVMTPGANVGSIGVYGLHKDVSAAAAAEGVKFTFVSAGKYKVEGNPYEPLTDEAKAAMQDPVDAYYSDFVGAVARGRGVAANDVINGFGEGRVVKDKQAVKMGMADRIGTLDETIKRVAGGKTKPGMKALSDVEVAAEDIANEPIEAAEPQIETAEAISSESEPLNMSAEERDAFRRRRHAHRMRSYRTA